MKTCQEDHFIVRPAQWTKERKADPAGPASLMTWLTPSIMSNPRAIANPSLRCVSGNQILDLIHDLALPRGEDIAVNLGHFRPTFD